jgi:hypothetical protein
MQTLALRDAAEWESWLVKHHATDPGVWLKIAKKGSAQGSVTAEEADEVALCYGWIDSTRKSHDREFFLQKFSPRRRGSSWLSVRRGLRFESRRGLKNPLQTSGFRVVLLPSSATPGSAALRPAFRRSGLREVQASRVAGRARGFYWLCRHRRRSRARAPALSERVATVAELAVVVVLDHECASVPSPLDGWRSIARGGPAAEPPAGSPRSWLVSSTK